MDDSTLLHLVSYGVAMVALIVAGAVGRGFLNRGGERQWWDTAAALVVALAAIYVAYRMSTRIYWGY